MNRASLPRSNPLLDWLRERRTTCGLQVRQIPFGQCEGWRFEEGRLVHRSGGFFSVIGIADPHDGSAQPIIDQPEIGVLGFLVQTGTKPTRWLIQAKTEPGNVDAVHLAPTVQATVSNYRRKHGGASTPHIDRFVGPAAPPVFLADVCQSEQGGRFLDKYNRNVVAAVAGSGPEPEGPAWRWCTSTELRQALLCDFALNTDARSVLVTSPWDLLGDGQQAFAAPSLARELATAFRHSRESDPDGGPRPLAELLARFRSACSKETREPRLLPLDRIHGWVLEPDQLRPLTPRGFSLATFSVHAPDREVPHWCQPLLRSDLETRCVLAARHLDGLLHFGFRLSREIGFSSGPQLGPSWQSDLVAQPPDWLAASHPRLEVRQSDEGGRFLQAVVRYEIREILPDAPPLDRDPHWFWCTLAQAERLVAIPGALTNESRSALSLVLALA